MKAQNPDLSEATSGDEQQEDGADDGWGGDEEVPAVDVTDEYVDEDKFTTVTIEAMDDDLRNPQTAEEEAAEEARSKAAAQKGARELAVKKNRAWQKGKTDVKVKKKKFRYESKAERKQGRQKQKSKNAAAAKALKGE